MGVKPLRYMPRSHGICPAVPHNECDHIPPDSIVKTEPPKPASNQSTESLSGYCTGSGSQGGNALSVWRLMPRFVVYYAGHIAVLTGLECRVKLIRAGRPLVMRQTDNLLIQADIIVRRPINSCFTLCFMLFAVVLFPVLLIPTLAVLSHRPDSLESDGQTNGQAQEPAQGFQLLRQIVATQGAARIKSGFAVSGAAANP